MYDIVANLPRDLQVCIFTRCDLDTRIKAQDVRKLNVPLELCKRLSSCLNTPNVLVHDNQEYIIISLYSLDNIQSKYVIMRELMTQTDTLTTIVYDNNMDMHIVV